MTIELGISGVIGLLFGSLLAWLALRSRTAALQERLSLTEKELAGKKADLMFEIVRHQGRNAKQNNVTLEEGAVTP